MRLAASALVADRLICPIIASAALTAFGFAATAANLIEHWYTSPYVALTALCAARCGVRAGLACAATSIAGHNYFFVNGIGWGQPPTAQVVAYMAMLAVTAVGVGAPHDAVTVEPEGRPHGPQVFPWAVGGCHWAVAPSGDWARDCEVGAEYGRIFVEDWQADARGPKLGWIVADMIKAGRYTGIEAGFLRRITESIAVGSPTERGALLGAIRQDSDADNRDLQRAVVELQRRVDRSEPIGGGEGGGQELPKQ